MENYSPAGEPQAKSEGVPPLLRAVGVEDLRAILQDAGYRVEALRDERGIPQLRSATSGVAFFVRFGNAAAGAEAFVDVTLYAVLRLQGSLPGNVSEEWNATRRFARLHRDGGLIVLQMDVSVIGGVTRQHLSAHIDIWDRLLNDLLRLLRDRLVSAAEA